MKLKHPTLQDLRDKAKEILDVCDKGADSCEKGDAEFAYASVHKPVIGMIELLHQAFLSHAMPIEALEELANSTKAVIDRLMEVYRESYKLYDEYLKNKGGSSEKPSQTESERVN